VTGSDRTAIKLRCECWLGDTTVAPQWGRLLGCTLTDRWPTERSWTLSGHPAARCSPAPTWPGEGTTRSGLMNRRASSRPPSASGGEALEHRVPQDPAVGVPVQVSPGDHLADGSSGDAEGVRGPRLGDRGTVPSCRAGSSPRGVDHHAGSSPSGCSPRTMITAWQDSPSSWARSSVTSRAAASDARSRASW